MTSTAKATLRLLLLTTALAGLAACNRDAEPAAKAVPAASATATVTPAEAGSLMSYESKTPWANVKLTLPEAIKAQPDLHARLYAEEVRKLTQFVEGAQGERTEAGSDTSQPPFENTVTVTAAAETGKLLSLRRTSLDFSGSQTNTLSSGLLWDKALKRQVGFADLFRKGADLSVLDQALCSAINAAKRARAPESASITFGGGPYACPKAADTPFVLTPGTVPGKAAGLTFLIGPFQVGPAGEGAYELAIPATTFRSLLATAYAGEFGGQLSKAGDVTKVPN